MLLDGISDTGLAAILGGVIGALTLITCFFAVEEIKEYFSSQEKNTHTIGKSDKGGQQPSSTLESTDLLNVEGKDKGLVT